MDLHLIFAYTGNAVELIPIITGFIFYKKESTKYRALLFFLLFGFAIDTSKLFIYSDAIRRWEYHIYSLVEIPFMLWFISKGISNKKIKTGIWWVISIEIIFWFFCRFIYEDSALHYSSLYDVTASVLVSGCCAYALLIMTQEETSFTSQPDFWFLTAIFFYYFAAGFLFNFLESDFLEKVWFLQNIIGIITYLIMTKAFLVIGKQGRIDDGR